ncbi:hypothetical protein [Devosia sp.]|uniref:hypothetical protein n=1 Tax=Devosia sp. TaxID=1871048 RepID=UPI00326525B0
MPKPPIKITVEDIDTAPLSTDGDEVQDAAYWREQHRRVAEEKAQLQASHDKLERRVRTTEILDDLIEPYAFRTFLFMCAYCGFVALAILAHGWHWGGFILPNSVLDFLVGSTAVTVIGLVGMVLTGIFVGARQKP